MKTATIAFAASLLCATAAAAPHPYMVQTNPNALAAAAVVDEECKGLTSETVEAVLDGVLIRSRIKPVEKSAVVLWVSVHCVADGENAFFFHIAFDFIDNKDGEIFRYGLESISASLGRYAKPGYLLDAIKSSMETVVTDYLRANFPELDKNKP